jgi:hypothetical protein
MRNIVTLSFGASLLASVITLFVYIKDMSDYQRGIFSILAIAGILFLAHGTGLLRRATNEVLRKWREKHSAIAIICDLPWSSEKNTYAWAWSEMSPEDWRARLLEVAKEKNSKTRIKLINITSKYTGFFLEQYNLIINPYGSVYPETDIKELTAWKTILSYVLDGGTFLSIADIPFYYAYDPVKAIRYNLNKHWSEPLKLDNLG